MQVRINDIIIIIINGLHERNIHVHVNACTWKYNSCKKVTLRGLSLFHMWNAGGGGVEVFCVFRGLRFFVCSMWRVDVCLHVVNQMFTTSLPPRTYKWLLPYTSEGCRLKLKQSYLTNQIYFTIFSYYFQQVLIFCPFFIIIITVQARHDQCWAVVSVIVLKQNVNPMSLNDINIHFSFNKTVQC